MTMGTPAILFGSIALIMLAYTNRFLALAKIIRDIHADYDPEHAALFKNQLPILRQRVRLIQIMQALGVLSFLFCTISMFVLFLHQEVAGKIIFALSVISMMTSLVFSLWEVLVSTRALDMVLDDFDQKHNS